MTVASNAFMYYAASEPVTAPALEYTLNPVFSEAAFTDLNTVSGKLSGGFEGIEKKDGKTVAFDSFTYDEAAGTFTVTFPEGTFPTNANTKGVTVSTAKFTEYQPAVLNLDHAKYKAEVLFAGATEEVAVAAMPLTAASIAIQDGVSVQEVSVPKLQDELLKQGATLVYMRGHSPADEDFIVLQKEALSRASVSGNCF